MYANFAPSAEVAAAWPKPNYVNPVTRGPAVPIICGILGSIALVAIIARIRSRFFIQRNSGIDDWVFLAAVPFVVTQSISVCLAVMKYKYNVHVWDMPPEMMEDHIKIMVWCCVSYVLAICPIRISVLCFYRRLAVRTVPAIITYTIWLSMSIEVAFLGICLATVCFPCHPLPSQWLRAIPGWTTTHEYSCFNTGDALFGIAFVSVFQDIIAVALPFGLILRMHLPRRQKIALVCTFAGGILVVCAGIVRLLFFAHLVWWTKDSTWAWYLFGGASNVEVLLATIFSSVPALKYYVRKHFEPSASQNQAYFVQQRNRPSFFSSKWLSASDETSDSSSGSDANCTSTSRSRSVHYVSAWDAQGKGLQQSVLESQLMEDGIITSAALLFDTTHPPSRAKPTHVLVEEETEEPL